MTTCPQCRAARRDLALAHINHHAKEIPMTPERLTWTPDDGPAALLAIRDRVKAAQDAGLEMEPMTAWVGGAVITDSPYIDEDDLMLVVSGLYVTVDGEPLLRLTRVEWTPPADPEPVALNEEPDPVARVGLFRHPWTKGSGVCTECGDTYHEHLWLDAGDHGHTICPKHLPTPTPPADPDPAWADAQAAIAVTSDRWFEIAQTSGEYDDRRGLWFTGGESQGRTVLGQAAEWRRDEATVYPLIRDGRVCAEAILALGVDDHGALLGGDDQ